MNALTQHKVLWRYGVLWLTALVFALGLATLSLGSVAHADEGQGQLTGGVIAAQDEVTIDSVRAAIQALPADPREYKPSDREHVEAVQADFDSLSAEDQAILDAECTHPGTSQALGRALETAVWSVWSFDAIDNSTTLPDGVYDATTTPALSAEYSKGKSTSARQRPWSVKSVEVKNGRATATVTVDSSTYPSMWKGGVTYPKTNASGNCEFAGVPIDLNSTFYFAGVSSSMPIPIAFALTTTIEEPAAPAITNLSITNEVGDFEAAAASIARYPEGNIFSNSVFLTMTLSGSDYQNLFKGTFDEAVANYDAIGNWIKGYQDAEGKWQFIVPITTDELTADIPIVAISQEEYNLHRYEGEPLKNAFIPYQVKIDLDSATLTTGKYEKAIAVPKAKTGLAYTGSAQVGVAAGEGYKLSGTSKAVNAGSYTATAVLADGYVWDDGTHDNKKVSWSIAKASIAKAKVTLAKASGAYNGKAQKGAVKSVVLNKRTLKAADYTVKAASGKKVGSYAVTVTGKGNYKGAAKATYKVTKAPAKAAVTKAKTYTVAQMKKAAASFVAVKLTTDGKAAWKVTKNSSKKYVAFSAGKVTVKKGAPKGKYTLTVNVSAKAGTNYQALKAKNYTITVTVK